MDYTIQSVVAGEFDDVVDETIAALEAEGFGVLSDIDVAATFDAKLDLDDPYRQYRILGACNPALAHDGLGEEIELGALLPCNVVVYETDDGDVAISAVDPQQLVGIAENDALDDIATEVSARFERALTAITDEFPAPTEA